MVRRLVLVLALMLTLIPLAAVTLVPGEGVDVPDEVLSLVADAINREGGPILPPGTDELSVDYYHDDGNATFITIEGWQLAFDDSRLEASIREEVRGFFLYPPFIDQSDGPRLDYIYNSSYSSVSLPSARLGEVYDLANPNGGRPLARFSVAETGEGYVSFDPIYVSHAYAGLPLEKAPSWFLTLTGFKNISLDARAGGSLRLKNSAWLYPFNPSVGFEAGLDDSLEPYYIGLMGIEYSLRLGGLVDSRITFVEEGAFYAGLDIALGYGDSSFLWGSSWRVGYSHMLSRHIGWAFGYEGQVLMAQNPLRAVLSQNRLSLSLEVAF